MLHKNIKLVSSNKNKIAEFKRFGLPCDVAEGIDIKEIQSNLEDVILYKALDAGVGNLVEDTVLSFNDEEIVDIRWRLSELAELKDPVIHWTTSLAVLDEDGFVYIYSSSIQCKLIDGAAEITTPDDAFGFDPYLVPVVNNTHETKTFYELEKEGIKDHYAPRKMAVNLLLIGGYKAKIKASQVPKWIGAYQND